MIEAALKELGEIEWDRLAAAEAIRLRAALAQTLARGDEWFAGLARDFGAVAAPAAAAPPSHPRATPEHQSAKVSKGRPRPPDPPRPVTTTPVKKARGRPLAKPHIRIGEKPPVTRTAPLAVGGADANGSAPAPAQLFQDSYVSHDGPLRPAELPPNHPRRALMRESSVSPEVDMSDFHEVEAAMRAGKGKELFQ